VLPLRAEPPVNMSPPRLRIDELYGINSMRHEVKAIFREMCEKQQHVNYKSMPLLHIKEVKEEMRSKVVCYI
jgi:hypothetical protein